jgi:hypothetical protein
MRLALTVLALALAVAGGASAATREGAAETARAPRFQVLAHVNPGGGYHGDVWGHRGFAYLSSHKGVRACEASGVRVYDLANPRRPRRVSTFADGRSEPAASDSWTEKTIVKHVATPAFTGELAVTSFQACSPGALGGFGLYDLSDPRSPKRLSVVRTSPRGSHEIWLQAVGDRAYVYTAIISSELTSSPDFNPMTGIARTPGTPDFRIYDVSDPGKPREVGSWGAWKELGIYPGRGLGPPNSIVANFVHSVITNQAGTRAYLSYWDLGTVILDVSDPTRPRYLGRTAFRPGSVGNAHSAWLGRGERLLIQTHETAGGVPVLYDISNKRRPVRLSTIRLPRAALAAGEARGGSFGGIDNSVHDVKIRGNSAYFSWYNQGVVLADVSRPRAPRFVARFLPPAARDPEALLCRGTSCTAVWGVYVDEPGLVLASDIISGLWVLRVR